MILSLPLKQLPNRVWRTYNGGALIDRWKNESTCNDGDTPEEWIASTVVARGNNRPEHEGLSKVITPTGTAFLKDLIETDPIAMLGERVAAKYHDTALLIKMLDSKERLTIQVHPDKTYAKKYLNSDFGKTEGWYVLGGREINGEPSYVLFGFKEWVTKEIWKDLFLRQDIEGMLQCLHKVPVKSGDAFIINGGVPHAIGSGCFLLEIQEPTDYTMRVEKTTPSGQRINDFLIHQGIGEEKMLDCFHYGCYTLEETLHKWKVIPKQESANIYTIFDHTHTDCFSLKLLDVTETIKVQGNGDYCVAVVASGSGLLITNNEHMDVRQGDEIFIPASVGDIQWQSNDSMKILLCFPPK